jgi:hypothetical protein
MKKRKKRKKAKKKKRGEERETGTKRCRFARQVGSKVGR